ncbi:MAG: hypothetical protein Q7T82_14210 [Armatimonadota bacterium]|nr:hypothetical protein [Armatimonadota bacterium]
MPETHDHKHPEVPKDVHPEIPEQTQDPSFRRWWVGGWPAALLTAGATIVWCLLIYALIHDRPAEWKYGVTPYVPAESIVSSEPPPRGRVPNQVVLPRKTPGGPNATR